MGKAESQQLQAVAVPCEKTQLALFTQNLKMSYYWLQYHSSI